MCGNMALIVISLIASTRKRDTPVRLGRIRLGLDDGTGRGRQTPADVQGGRPAGARHPSQNRVAFDLVGDFKDHAHTARAHRMPHSD
jgi:hypothetical protein